jgi:CRISPR-associated protein Cas2
MHIIVCYDVNTETPAGRRRLRKVAETCQDFGQRVQFSVFECSVHEMQLEVMRSKLLSIIDDNLDSLRIYRLTGKRESCVESYGRDKYEDFDAPLVV